MKILKILGKVVLFGAGLVVLVLLISTLYHNYQLRIEADEYPPPGEMVEVNNNDMHVYSDGRGDLTFVFMPGGGSFIPTIDFKPIWMRLKEDYRISVVERAGYGWSETSSSPRDIDTILKETRKALELSEEEAPYVLVPQSVSGLEAIYWAQKYPDEVKAIIGLDAAVPGVYLNSSFETPSKSGTYAMYFMARMGLTRVITRFVGRATLEEQYPLLKSEELSKEDKEMIIPLFIEIISQKIC